MFVIWYFKIGSHPIAQASLELVVVLIPQPQKCWDYGCEPPLQAPLSFTLLT